MKRIILSMLVIGIMSALANAESCTSVGATDKKYTPSGCAYKTENRICCDDKQWSAWKEGEVNKATDCKKGSECTDGEIDTGTVELWGSNAEWSGKVVGSKTCQRKCVNGKWEYSLKSISCNSGWHAVSGGIDGKMCQIGRVSMTGKIKGHPNTNKKPGDAWKVLSGAVACNKDWVGYWWYVGEEESEGRTHYRMCVVDYDFFVIKGYQVEDEYVDWSYTLPEGCEGKFNFSGKEGETCTDIGACTAVYRWKSGYTGQFLQCMEEDNTSYDENDCASAGY